jgi:hypothetical protein
MSDKLCSCGSGQSRYDLTDARGIFCCYVCDECKQRKALRYRIEVLEDPDYDCDEEIEADPEDAERELSLEEEIEQAYFDALDKDD